MARILVTETIADRGLAKLRDAGHDVDVQEGLTPAQLLAAVAGAHALIIRSATKVTAEVIEAGSDLVCVGRAGIGLDNVDVDAATRRGVMVVNAPQSNVVSAAEHTMALLLASARNVAQAHAALKQGKWERTKWEGVELHGKTLGIVGLGRVGALVAQRCLAFGMRLVAFDPYVSAERARAMGVDLLALDEVVRVSDFLSIHLPKTKETAGLIGADLLRTAKRDLRVINTARGGIVDEEALAAAVRDGTIAGAALDVFNEEPCTESPLFELDTIVVTPHLGASTREAQDKAGDTIADMVLLAMAGEFVPFAVNVSAAEASETVRPFLPLAERLGRLVHGVCEGVPSGVEIAYEGEIADYDTRILSLSVLKGLLAGATDEPVTYVNAPQLAERHGLTVGESKVAQPSDYRNMITIRTTCGHAISGTLAGLRREPRIVMIDGHDVEVPPSKYLIIVRNDDRPGMVGLLGVTLADAHVNIADMALGRAPSGKSALMVAATDQPVPDAVVERLRQAPGITDVIRVEEL